MLIKANALTTTLRRHGVGACDHPWLSQWNIPAATCHFRRVARKFVWEAKTQIWGSAAYSTIHIIK